MKKIGIITFHKAHNYGAVLQAFALSTILSKSYNVVIINYYNPKVYDSYKIIRPIQKNIIKSLKNTISDIMFLNRNTKRYNNFENFVNKNLKLTKECYNIEEITQLSKKYDTIITGSDQVWSYTIVNELSDIYTLNFHNNNIKKISYAASVGDINYIINHQQEYKEKISQLDYISVREESTQEELSKIINKPIITTLDPTLLLTQQEWNNKLKKLNNNIKEKYIIAYVVIPDNEYIKIANYLSEKTGLKIIYFDKRNKGYNNTLKSSYTEGPLEFINYIKNAEYVVTTSFHATVFSIIFNKNFFVVPPKKIGNRITDLLNKLNITNRVYYTLEDFQKIDYNLTTNWNQVNKKLEEARQKSIDWLINSIEK